MANTTTKYVVTTEEGTQEFGNLGLVGKFLGKKITKKDLEAGKYPMVTLQDAEVEDEPTKEEEVVEVVETPVEPEPVVEPVDEPTKDEPTDNEPDTTEPVDEPELDEKTKHVLDLIGQAINETPEDNTELFDSLCNLEDSITEGIPLTDEQATLLTKILTNTLNEGSVDTGDTDDNDEEDTPKSKQAKPNVDPEQDYPEVGEFKDEKAMKKFIKGLSDESLEEWCTLEGVEWKHNDHAAINRMRMAMAIKALHFKPATTGKSKKSKSKYAHYTTEELVQMALDNDIEVPDDKGDMRICRMYTIIALRNAGLIEQVTITTP